MRRLTVPMLSGDRPPPILVAVLCLIMVGCAAGQEDVPTATIAPTATAPEKTVELESADVPATPTDPIPTDTPEPIISPTHAPIPTPDVPLDPEGPWLLFLASTIDPGDWSRQIWAVNADGTGLTELVDEHVMTFRAQPVDSLERGFKIAYVTQEDWPFMYPTLKIITMPGGEVKTITLLSDQTGADPPVPAHELVTAVQEGGLAWSPDGRWLAFVGAMDGKSIEVYVYDTFSDSIIRLTVDSHHACHLSWSPGGDYVLYEGFDFLGMGGPQINGLWSVQVDGLETFHLAGQSQDYYVISYEQTWLSSTRLLLVSWAYEDESDVRVVDIESGTGQVILREIFSSAAYAPEHNIWLLARSEWLRSEKGGAPLTLHKGGERIDISGYNIEYVKWIPTSDLFIGKNILGEFYTISLDGQVDELLVEPDWQLWWPLDVYVSPDETLWIWFLYDFYASGSELWIGDPLQEPTLIQATGRNVPDTSWIHDLTWSPDNQRMLMLGSDGLCIAERPAFEPICVVEGLFAHEWYEWEAEWIPLGDSEEVR